MLTLDDADWRLLEATAKSVKYPIERIGLLRQRLGGETSRPGSPWTLLVGRPDAGIELILARFYAANVADALKAAGDRPLVIGPEPSQIRPALGSWPVFPTPARNVGHVVALRTARTPSPEILLQVFVPRR